MASTWSPRIWSRGLLWVWGQLRIHGEFRTSLEAGGRWAGTELWQGGVAALGQREEAPALCPSSQYLLLMVCRKTMVSLAKHEELLSGTMSHQLSSWLWKDGRDHSGVTPEQRCGGQNGDPRDTHCLALLTWTQQEGLWRCTEEVGSFFWTIHKDLMEPQDPLWEGGRVKRRHYDIKASSRNDVAPKGRGRR